MFNNTFSESAEIRNITKPISEGSGFVVPVGDELRVFDDYHHSIEYGRTGVGKSESGSGNTVQSICSRGESAVIVDPKGELYARTKDMFEASGYEIRCLDFRDPYKSQSFNPLFPDPVTETFKKRLQQIKENDSSQSEPQGRGQGNSSLKMISIIHIGLPWPASCQEFQKIRSSQFQQGGCGHTHQEN